MKIPSALITMGLSVLKPSEIQLGDKIYGNVYHADYIPGREKVPVRQVLNPKSYNAWDSMVKQPVVAKCARTAEEKGILENEAIILSRYSDPLFVHAIGQVQGKKPCLVFEPYESDLLTWLIDHPPKTMQDWKTIKEYSKQMVTIVQHLQLKGLVHQDIKLENFLLKEGQLYLNDFGFAFPASQPPPIHESRGTLTHAAPEQLMGKMTTKMTPSVDVYALGVALYMLLTRSYPYDILPRHDDPFMAMALRQASKIDLKMLKILPTNSICKQDVCSRVPGTSLEPLFKELLAYDEKKRLKDLNQILDHPWFQ